MRKIARLTNCSLGSIYNAFDDFQTLQIHINSKILTKLYESLESVVNNINKEEQSLKDVLKDLGMEYYKFASNNKFLWKSLFEFSPQEDLPDWYAANASKGIYALCSRLAKTYGVPEEKMKEIVGFFWSSVHGKTAIFLNKKMDMVADLFKEDSLDSYIEFCLEGLPNVTDE
ncbi:MAG: TetR/AcrR family transcriptional regulator [Simkaniaceae bacterium]|nr:TetR/AcrR family transcriptional regulator [Candidatus Sacchlamyda saccharinae]